ncbi:beta strand repeat-containing protein, partial [Flavobacterium sp. XS2P14]|uniref:beta strand repeat-containing protein n=1 Tax=Flavobacterium sp. XS2P14 TaxID=3401735 RepID=UPI003AABCBB6
MKKFLLLLLLTIFQYGLGQTTWTGAINTDWNTPSNWSTGAVPTAIDVVVIPNVTNKPIITGITAACADLTINALSSLTLTNSVTSLLNIGGNFVNNGTFTSVGASTISFVGANQIVAGVTYSNLTLGGTGTKTFAANTIITTNLMVVAGVKMNLNAINTHQTGTLTLGGDGALLSTWGASNTGASNGNNIYFTGPGRITVTGTPPYPRIENNFASYTSGASGTVGASYPEGATSSPVTAPDGLVFINVNFASYGTPTGTSPNYVLGACHALTSITEVNKVILGVTTGKVPTFNGAYGDPCGGTPKRINVVASYAEPICSGTNPGTITGSTPTGGNNVYSYLWEFNTVGAYSPYATTPGVSTSKDYIIPSGITQTTWYRRTVTSGMYYTTTIVLVQVNTNPTAPTTITGGTSICSGASTTLTVSGGNKGGGGGYAQWFTGSCGGTLVGTGNSLVVSPTVNTTYYIRYKNVCSVTSCITTTVTVAPAPSITTAAASVSVCSSASLQTTPLSYSSTTGTPTTYSITWNATPTNSFVAVTNAALPASAISIAVPANATSGTYTGNLTVKNAGGCASSTTIFNVTVQATPTAGSIAVSQTICDGGDPATFTSTTAGTGDGTITYRWESAVSPFSTWSAISGVITATYDAPTGLTATTQYKRITISTLNSVACESTATSPVTVTVQATPTAGSIADSQTICNGGDPATFTSTAAGMGDGIITYRWESSVSPFSTWSAISGVTVAAYDAPTGLTATTQYRRITVSILSGIACESAATSPVTVTVQSTPTAGAISANQTIYYEGDPAAFTSTTAGTGDVTSTYRWESAVSPFNTWNTISGATVVTYDAPTGLTSTTQYRRITISTLNTVACESSATTPITVTVLAVIVADDDTLSTLAAPLISGTSPVTAGNVLENDTRNGVAATTTNTNVTPLTTGPLSIDADGIVTLAANTPSGTYSITYQLCEADPSTGLNMIPANCDNATATVVVLNLIDAVNDGPATVASATTPTVILNVTDNDTLNTIAVTGANTDVTPITTGPLSIDINGNLTLAANTASGTYLITYELCESGASPANCNTAIVTVVVQNPLLAVNDGPLTVATAEVPKVVLNVTINDTLHADPVTDANTNVTPQISGPLSITSNGEITLAANIVSGTYSITYEICEVGANPVNCTTATATIVVLNAIIANPDITGGLPGATTGSVLGNDTLSGIPPVEPADVILTTTALNPVLTLNANGTITIAAGTPAGPQTLEYRICEIGSNPANCSTATVTVNVLQSAVDAIVDDFTAVPYTGGNGGTTTSVLNNDTLNGAVLNPADVNLTLSGTAPTGFVLNSNGTITVPSGQVSGTNMVFYQICEAINPGNCDIANAKIRISNQINAFDDAFPPQAPSTTVVTTVGSVLANNGNGADNLNGIAVTSTNTDVTPVTTGPLRIDADGNLTLAPNTVSGTYTITYKLCEAGADPVNCTNATATVVVLNPIDAVDDNPVAVNTGVNPKVVFNVTDNDTLNTVLVSPTNTNVTPVFAGPLSIDSNGVVTLAGNTPSGSYSITYELCEVNPSTGLAVTPTNCNSAVATIKVLNSLDAVVDTLGTPAAPLASGTTPVAAGSVIGNDTLNGVAVTIANTNVTPITTGPILVDADGNVTIAANTPTGPYTVTYTICESDTTTGVNVSPSNCTTATLTVNVVGQIIAGNDTLGTPLAPLASGTTPVAAGSVIGNDTLNGVAVTTTNTNVTPITTGAILVDADGNVTIAANTPTGPYTVTYSICESDTTTGVNVSPSNCTTATLTVNVVGQIIAGNDTLGTPLAPLASGTTPVAAGSVIGNDTLNGVAVTTTNTNVTPITTGPILVDADGNVTIAANTPTGPYTVTYTICESDTTTGVNVNPSNCTTATLTVNVVGQIIAGNDTLGTPLAPLAS